MQNKIWYGLMLTASVAMGCSDVSAPANEVQSFPTATEAAIGNCTDAEYRQLDFWVGDWDLTWKQADGMIGQGRNVITRSPFDNCVIMENFNGAPSMQFKGMSVSTYHKPAKMWRQAWVDDQGGFFSLYGGPQADGTFKLDMERIGGQGPYRRMIWEDINKDSLVWRWQGKAKAEDEWADAWVINYKRRSI